MEEKIEYNGFTIEKYQDDYAENPFEFAETLGTLYTAHRKYCPDKELLDKFEFEEVFDDSGEFKKKFLDKYFALKVYLLDHSGLRVRTTSFSNRWDSGLFGVICCTKDKAIEYAPEEFDDEKLEEYTLDYMRSEIDLLDTYYSEGVYGYTLTDDSGEEVDSCCGFYGFDAIDEAVLECKKYVDSILLKRKEKLGNQLQLNFN